MWYYSSFLCWNIPKIRCYNMKYIDKQGLIVILFTFEYSLNVYSGRHMWLHGDMCVKMEWRSLVVCCMTYCRMFYWHITSRTGNITILASTLLVILLYSIWHASMITLMTHTRDIYFYNWQSPDWRLQQVIPRLWGWWLTNCAIPPLSVPEINNSKRLIFQWWSSKMVRFWCSLLLWLVYDMVYKWSPNATSDFVSNQF